MRKRSPYILTLLLLLAAINYHSQTALSLSFTLNTFAEICEKGGVLLKIAGTESSDSVFVDWSTGEKNVYALNQLSKGDHNVHIRVKRKKGTSTLSKDTILNYSIEKEDCGVGVPKYFSPNDDLYNDLLLISNLQYYPDFELEIFNKWGQRVHHQKQSYTPWDGKWLGAELADGTYFYILFFKSTDKSKFVKGDITILR